MTAIARYRMSGMLLEIDNDRVGCQWHVHLFPHPAHSRHAEDGVFQIVEKIA
jgi:hypothetical protein